MGVTEAWVGPTSVAIHQSSEVHLARPPAALELKRIGILEIIYSLNFLGWVAAYFVGAAMAMGPLPARAQRARRDELPAGPE